jgi:hypothetical protein
LKQLALRASAGEAAGDKQYDLPVAIASLPTRAVPT